MTAARAALATAVFAVLAVCAYANNLPAFALFALGMAVGRYYLKSSARGAYYRYVQHENALIDHELGCRR